MAYVQIGITETGNVKKFKGYSIDSKPTSDIGSGSKCYEQDTKKVWTYDSVNKNPGTNDNWWLDNVDENDFADIMEAVDISAQLGDIMNLKSDIRGTTQNVTTNASGDITQVEHVNGSSVVLRRDTFDYSTANLIVETRTWISTGDTLIFKYHTDTLATEVI